MKSKGLLTCFVIVMFITVSFVAWYLSALGQIRFRIDETEKSLETSFGREKKQSFELGETIGYIPVARMKLDLISPIAEKAHEELNSLKAERKKLRAQKKELEGKLESENTSEVDTP